MKLNLMITTLVAISSLSAFAGPGNGANAKYNGRLALPADAQNLKIESVELGQVPVLTGSVTVDKHDCVDLNDNHHLADSPCTPFATVTPTQDGVIVSISYESVSEGTLNGRLIGCSGLTEDPNDGCVRSNVIDAEVFMSASTLSKSQSKALAAGKGKELVTIDLRATTATKSEIDESASNFCHYGIVSGEILEKLNSSCVDSTVYTQGSEAVIIAQISMK